MSFIISTITFSNVYFRVEYLSFMYTYSYITLSVYIKFITQIPNQDACCIYYIEPWFQPFQVLEKVCIYKFLVHYLRDIQDACWQLVVRFLLAESKIVFFNSALYSIDLV